MTVRCDSACSRSADETKPRTAIVLGGFVVPEHGTALHALDHAGVGNDAPGPVERDHPSRHTLLGDTGAKVEPCRATSTHLRVIVHATPPVRTRGVAQISRNKPGESRRSERRATKETA